MPNKTGLLYDCRQLNHINLFDPSHPEHPDRIKKTFAALGDLKQECVRIYPSPTIPLSESIFRAHSKTHIAEMASTEQKSREALLEVTREHQYDVYFCGETYQCALLSVQGVITIAEAVFKGEVDNGIAIVRPPGHHAEFTQYYINNTVQWGSVYSIT